MKYAHSFDGRQVPADMEAPRTAVCPFCGNEVVLRQRRVMMSKDPVYFWRHKRKIGRGCPGRSRFISN